MKFYSFTRKPGSVLQSHQSFSSCSPLWLISGHHYPRLVAEYIKLLQKNYTAFCVYLCDHNAVQHFLQRLDVFCDLLRLQTSPYLGHKVVNTEQAALTQPCFLDAAWAITDMSAQCTLLAISNPHRYAMTLSTHLCIRYHFYLYT